jgi:hypothetical protein
MSIEIELGDYVFSFFQSNNRSVSASVEHLSGVDLGEKDIERVRELLSDIGKWECMLKASLNFLYDTGLVNVQETAIKAYDKQFGAELYSLHVGIEGYSFNRRYRHFI